jgi:hypothetical protein
VDVEEEAELRAMVEEVVYSKKTKRTFNEHCNGRSQEKNYRGSNSTRGIP